jgi:hypothetical protein
MSHGVYSPSSIRPLRVEELAKMLAIRFDEALSTYWHPAYAEEMIMSVCSSLIAIVDRGGHQVVQLYLLVATTPSPSSFFILLDLPHRPRSHARVHNLLHHALPHYAR